MTEVPTENGARYSPFDGSVCGDVPANLLCMKRVVLCIRISALTWRLEYSNSRLRPLDHFPTKL